MNGYIKLYRKFLDWWWYSDIVVKSVFLHILLNVSYKDFEWKGNKYKAGQLITSRPRLATQIGISMQQLKTALNKLSKSGVINLQSTNQYTVITVLNWGLYQVEDNEEQPTKRSQSTDDQPHLKNKETRINPLCSSPRRRERRKKESNYAAYNIEEFEATLDLI